MSLASGMSNKIDLFANDCKGKIQSIAKYLFKRVNICLRSSLVLTLNE
jgi:hypothetical protein